MTLRLGELLVEQKIITTQELDIAVREHQKSKEFLGKTLVRLGYVSEKKVLQILSKQQGILFVELSKIPIEKSVIDEVPAKFAWHYKIMPVSLEGNVLTVAISDPFDVWGLDDLETNLNYRVDKVLATSSDILEAIRKYYGVGAETIERILSQGSDEDNAAREQKSEVVQDLEKMAEDASVVKLVNQILHQAIEERATDIHIEHFHDEVFLRYRIDGVLYDRQVHDEITVLYPAIVSRVKVMSGLDIIERRIPQDGRAKVKIARKEFDLRVSIMPTLYGENIVIRILPSAMLFSINQLGMSTEDGNRIEKLIQKPHGIIIVTGPTGSGKTTTLYACLSKLNTRERKIVTIEDPIEYELKGVSQTQINQKINLTFARVLRSMLRHDPDVMMVGEIRDQETAEITIQTSLTGHLVFSTLHTNDAAGGITRLLDMGIEPFLITSSIEVFIAQRLVRVICEKCKEGLRPKDSIVQILEKLGDPNGIRPELPHMLQVYRGKGCKACGNTGYFGRTGIYEILLLTPEIKELIMQKSSSDAIKRKACENGMKTLLEDGWQKVLQGITTPEELMRVTQQD